MTDIYSNTFACVFHAFDDHILKIQQSNTDDRWESKLLNFIEHLFNKCKHGKILQIKMCIVFVLQSKLTLHATYFKQKCLQVI